MRAIKSFFKFSLFLLALLLLASCDEGEKIPEEVIYTITFHSNSGSEVSEITEILGTNITKPRDPTRIGYTFRGWYFDIELTELVTWPFVLTTDLTLYAKWSEDSVEVTTYDITFNTMGGSVINPLDIEEGTIISKPSNPIKDGYIFINWYLDENYTNLASFPITVTSNLTLYAKWEETNTNQVNFSYYELSEVNISKMIHSGLNKLYGDSSYLLTSEGKLLLKERIFNQITNERDWMYFELPFSLTGSLANEKIVDAIIYEPVVLFKIESGRWFGIEIGDYATGDYLGVANEIISVDLMLGLDFDETIVQINKAERFFYAFTSKNRVFVAGTLELDYEPLYTFNEPLEITDEFELDQDEHFIPNDLLFEAVGENQIALRTNKRIFLPRELVVTATGDLSLSQENSYFIDINDIDNDTYQDGIFIYREDQVSLQLLSDNDVQLYQYYDGEHQTNTYDFVLNPDETIFVLGAYFMTNQNRMFSIDEFYEIPIDEQITDFLVAYSSRENSMFSLYPLFKSNANKYYIVGDGIDNMIDITDAVSGYTLVNGFWVKDEQSYIYDIELEQMVLNQVEAITIKTEIVEKNSIISIPVFNDERYLVDEWLPLPDDLVITDHLLLLPIFYNPELVDLYVQINILGQGGHTIWYSLPIGETYTLSDILPHLIEDFQYYGLTLDLNYLELLGMKKDSVEVTEVTLNQQHQEISIYFALKENVTIVSIYYQNPNGNLYLENMYAMIGQTIDFDSISNIFDYPVAGWYDSESFNDELSQNVYTEEMNIYVKLDYPMSSITFVLSHDQGERTIDYVTGYSPNMNSIYEEFSNNSLYRINGIYADASHTQEVSSYNFSNYETLYIDLGRAFRVSLYGVASDKIYDREVEFVEGRYFSDVLRYIDFNYHDAIAFYYDQEHTQEIDPDSTIPYGIEHIYIEFVEQAYKNVKIVIVGHEEQVIKFKFYDGYYRLEEMLEHNLIFVEYISFYTSSLLDNYFASTHSYVSYDEIPSTLYVSDNPPFYRFVNIENNLDIIIVANFYSIDYELQNCLFDVLGFDNYQVFNQENVEVTDFFNYTVDGFETFELVLGKLPRTTVTFVINDILYPVDDLRLGELFSNDSSVLNTAVTNQLDDQDIFWDDYAFYLDPTYETPWDNIITEDLMLYVHIIVYPRTDVIAIVNDEELVFTDVIINRPFFELSYHIHEYLIEHGIEVDDYAFYTDSSYLNHWDLIVYEQLIVYVKLITHPRTQVTVMIGEESFVIDDVIMIDHYSYVYNRIYEYLEDNEITYDYFGIYYDQAFLSLYDYRILEDNEILYVEIIIYTRTSLTIYINNEIVTNDEFRLGLDFVRYEIIEYLFANDMYGAYQYIIYHDSDYQVKWNNIEFENMILYVELINTSQTTTLNVIYDQETIYSDDVNLGSMSINSMRVQIMTYFSSLDIYADDLAFYVDEGLTIRWDGYVRVNQVLYVKNVVFEMTEVTVYIDQDISFTVNVLTGPNNAYIIENSIRDYLDNHDISYDYVEMFFDSNLTTYWDYYITENMVIYLDIIFYERTTVYLHIGEFILEVEDIQVNRSDYYKIDDAVMNYLNANSIPWDNFNIFEDETYTIDFNYYPHELMHLYVEVTLHQRTSVTVHVNELSFIIENVIMDGQYNGSIRNNIQSYLYNQNIEHDAFEIYIDDLYLVFWDNIVTDDMHLYIKTIIYPVTTVSININGDILTLNDMKLNGSNLYIVNHSIIVYTMENSIFFNEYLVYVDQDYITLWDYTVTSDMMLYVVFVNYTMDYNINNDFSGYSEYILLSEDFTYYHFGDFSSQALHPETYFITFENENFFIYAVYMTNGTYAYLYHVDYIEFYDLTIDDALSHLYDGELVSRFELTTVSEINTRLSSIYETWEDFLYEFSLNEYLEVYVLENEWLIDGIVVHSIDIVVGYQGYYNVWYNFA